MSKNFKIADINPESFYTVSLIDNWDGSAEQRTMTGAELISFTNASLHHYDIHAEEEPQKTENTVEKILEFFEDNEEIFNSCIEELDNYNGYLGDNRYYSMDELDEIYSNTDPTEILARAYYGYDAETWTKDAEGYKNYGCFCPNREYFYFNGYGNLVSADYKDYASFLDCYVIEAMSENRYYISTIKDNEELMALFDELDNETLKSII